jgi:hypothetical protein
MSIAEKFNSVEWAERTAQRLRWAYAGTADMTPAAQQAHLAGEVEHLANELPSNSRREALRELLSRFPGLERAPSEMPAMDPAMTMGLPFVLPPSSPEDLATQLADAWSKLDGEQKAAIEAKLTAAGVIRKEAPRPARMAGGLVGMEQAREQMAVLKIEVLKARLEIDDVDSVRPLDLYWVFSLMDVLLQHTEQMDRLAATIWPIWKKLAPSSRLQSPTGRSVVVQAAREFLTGVDRENLDRQLSGQESALRLMVAIISAIGAGGKNFAQQLTHLLAPENIARDAKAAKLRGNTQEAAWTRYEQVSNDLTVGTLEQMLRDAVAHAGEELFRSKPNW